MAACPLACASVYKECKPAAAAARSMAACRRFFLWVGIRAGAAAANILTQHVVLDSCSTLSLLSNGGGPMKRLVVLTLLAVAVACPALAQRAENKRVQNGTAQQELLQLEREWG